MIRAGRAGSTKIEDVLARCDAEARGRDVPEEAIAAARRATARAAAGWTGGVSATRLRRYFDRVVNAHVVRRADAGRAAARIMVATVVAELRETGRDDGAVLDELERGWAGRIPVDILDEVRARLCA